MNFILIKLFFSVVISFLLTYYFVPIFIKIAHKFSIIDHPDGVVKKHKTPTPYLGGAAIYLGILTTLGITFPFDNQFFLFLVGCTILFYVGLIDDLIALRPSQKFAGQAVAVLCFLKAGFYLKSHIFYNYWNIPISALWMLIIINAFNLIDIMDGLAGTVALFCSLSFLFIALLMHNYTVALLLCSFIGALTAFFIFNRPKARIYLGDAGSLFIGGFFATIPFLYNWGTINWHGYLVPLIILAIPLLEVGGLILLRTAKNIPFYHPSPDHFAIYLKNKGFGPYQILIFVMAASIILMICSILFVQGLIDIVAVLVLGSFFLLFWLYCIFL
ncbi:MAG: MraY family glycosyltransferase [Candidatus Dependentiae bacterium]